MKCLLVFYSYSGNNKKLVLDIKDKIKCDIIEIKEIGKWKILSNLIKIMFKGKTQMFKYKISLKNYEKIVFVTQLIKGNIAKPLQKFIKSEKDNIKDYYFVSICNKHDKQKDTLVKQLTSLIKHSPLDVINLPISESLPSNQKNKINFNHRFYCDIHDIVA